MKMKIERKVTVEIDTAIERKRIKSAFKNRPDLAKKLNALMDLIEAQEWKKAADLVDGKWWSGYDKKEHCCRREFIGCLNDSDSANKCFSLGGGSLPNYVALIYWFTECADEYKIIEV